MASQTDTILEIARKYLAELRNSGIPIQKAILYGSFAKGTENVDSDIDIALISEIFTNDRFLERRRLVPLRRSIDNRLEPMPFNPKTFAQGGILIDEIKKTGIPVNPKNHNI